MDSVCVHAPVNSTVVFILQCRLKKGVPKKWVTVKKMLKGVSSHSFSLLIKDDKHNKSILKVELKNAKHFPPIIFSERATRFGEQLNANYRFPHGPFLH